MAGLSPGMPHGLHDETRIMIIPEDDQYEALPAPLPSQHITSPRYD